MLYMAYGEVGISVFHYFAFCIFNLCQLFFLPFIELVTVTSDKCHNTQHINMKYMCSQPTTQPRSKVKVPRAALRTTANEAEEAAKGQWRKRQAGCTTSTSTSAQPSTAVPMPMPMRTRRASKLLAAKSKPVQRLRNDSAQCARCVDCGRAQALPGDTLTGGPLQAAKDAGGGKVLETGEE
jgi:hypothetical protein